MIGIGIGIPLTRTTSGPTLGTTIATTHYNRVIADGGVLPSGISGLGSVLDSVISAYGVTDSTDFNTKVPVFLDPHYTGYKLGAGSGTTLGQAARTVYAISSSADVTQSTAASQPLLLAHSGDNYWWNGGVSGNYCSTPNASANQITAKDMIAEIQGDLTTGYKAIIAKCDSAGHGMYLLGITSGKLLNYGKNSDGVVSTVALPYNNGDRFWIRATYDSGVVTFYTGINGTSWTQLGNTVAV